MHSFHAFIDESGDEGFIFKDHPEKASSEWFAISACIVRATRMLPASRELRSTFDPIEAARKAPAHFAALPHDARVAVVNGIAKLPIRVAVVAINKRSLKPGHTLGGNRRIHFYAARYLLERISWIARDHTNPGEGNGQCKLTFSHCKGLSYSILSDYFEKLKGQQTQIAWDHVDSQEIKVLPHADSVWLRAADATASSATQALELSRHGFCEHRYITTLKPAIYNIKGNYLSYGMKIFPQVPAVEKERDNRYDWLSLYK